MWNNVGVSCTQLLIYKKKKIIKPYHKESLIFTKTAQTQSRQWQHAKTMNWFRIYAATIINEQLITIKKQTGRLFTAELTSRWNIPDTWHAHRATKCLNLTISNEKQAETKRTYRKWTCGVGPNDGSVLSHTVLRFFTLNHMENQPQRPLNNHYQGTTLLVRYTLTMNSADCWGSVVLVAACAIADNRLPRYCWNYKMDSEDSLLNYFLMTSSHLATNTSWNKNSTAISQLFFLTSHINVDWDQLFTVTTTKTGCSWNYHINYLNNLL